MSLKNNNFSILDSFLAQIAILDPSGTIIHVNDAWTEFALDNGADDVVAKGIGINYLNICGADQSALKKGASEIMNGINNVLSGKVLTFTFHYPCHSPNEERWFWMRVTPYKNLTGHALVSHFNVTERVLAEQALSATHNSARSTRANSYRRTERRKAAR
ncbi:MAG: PAS domain-containing protein [Planctomycetota bacterium]|jgi:PAS domain-containing protein